MTNSNLTAIKLTMPTCDKQCQLTPDAVLEPLTLLCKVEIYWIVFNTDIKGEMVLSDIDL